MSAASVDRQLSQARARRKKARWPEKCKAVRQQAILDVAAARRQALQASADADQAVAEAKAETQIVRDKLEAIYANGPAVFELTHIRQRWLGARWWWCLMFALTGRFRFERH